MAVATEVVVVVWELVVRVWELVVVEVVWELVVLVFLEVFQPLFEPFFQPSIPRLYFVLSQIVVFVIHYALFLVFVRPLYNFTEENIYDELFKFLTTIGLQQVIAYGATFIVPYRRN